MEPSITDNELELQGDQRQPVMPRHGGLLLTTEIALTIFKSIIVTEGIKVARREYKHMCYVFSALKEWSGIAQAINELLEQEAERKRKLLSHLGNAPTFFNFGIYNEILTEDNNITNLEER